MYLTNHRLNESCIKDLHGLIRGVYPLPEPAVLQAMCSAKDPGAPVTQVYGIYHENELVSVMTATYCYVFPHADSPQGKVVHISGAYTRPDMRRRGLAAQILQAIEQDAVRCFHADYMCCDSVADRLYTRAGFVHSPEDETRLWKQLPYCQSICLESSPVRSSGGDVRQV